MELDNADRPTAVAPSQSREVPCPTCAAAATASLPTTFVYAIGRIEARFPQLSVEKEFSQAIGRNETAVRKRYSRALAELRSALERYVRPKPGPSPAREVSR